MDARLSNSTYSSILYSCSIHSQSHHQYECRLLCIYTRISILELVNTEFQHFEFFQEQKILHHQKLYALHITDWRGWKYAVYHDMLESDYFDVKQNATSFLSGPLD